MKPANPALPKVDCSPIWPQPSAYDETEQPAMVALLPLVGVAVDVPGWSDPQRCSVCSHAFDAAAQEPCPHTSDPPCGLCAAECRACFSLARQGVDGL